MLILFFKKKKKKLKNVMWCKFWSNYSLFLISTSNISYIIIPLMFFEKIRSMTVSQQLELANILHDKNNNHTLHILHIFLESSYKLVTWLEKFEKIWGCSFDIASSYFFRPSKFWSMLHHGSVGRVQNKIKET